MWFLLLTNPLNLKQKLKLSAQNISSLYLYFNYGKIQTFLV